MIEKYIIDKSDIRNLLMGKELDLPQGHKARAFCVEVLGDLTNGEVIMTLFSDVRIRYIMGPCVEVDITGFGRSCFALDWWNTPYKAENKTEQGLAYADQDTMMSAT